MDKKPDKIIRNLLKRLRKVKDEYNANFDLMRKAAGTPRHKIYVAVERKLHTKERALTREIPLIWRSKIK